MFGRKKAVPQLISIRQLDVDQDTSAGAKSKVKKEKLGVSDALSKNRSTTPPPPASSLEPVHRNRAVAASIPPPARPQQGQGPLERPRVLSSASDRKGDRSSSSAPPPAYRERAMSADNYIDDGDVLGSLIIIEKKPQLAARNARAAAGPAPEDKLGSVLVIEKKQAAQSPTASIPRPKIAINGRPRIEIPKPPPAPPPPYAQYKRQSSPAESRAAAAPPSGRPSEPHHPKTGTGGASLTKPMGPQAVSVDESSRRRKKAGSPGVGGLGPTPSSLD